MITFLYVCFFPNSEFQRKMRLLRKDDMCLVSSKAASPRTPTVLQKEPSKFQASSSVRKVLSVVADSTGRNYSIKKVTRIEFTESYQNFKRIVMMKRAKTKILINKISSCKMHLIEDNSK